MNILYVMIPVSILLSASFVAGFIWTVSSGQLDDVNTPAHRILDLEDEGKDQQQ